MFSSISDLHSLNPSVTLSLCDKKKSSPDISKCPLLFVDQLLSHVQIVATPYPLSLRHISFSCIFSCATHSFTDFSVTQSCPTLCGPMDYSMPGFPVLHHLPEFAQIHFHWVSGAIQPFYLLLPASPPAFNLFYHQHLFQWAGSLHQKVKSLSRVRLCDPTDGSLPGFYIHGIFQARIVESVAISFSRGPLGKLDQVFHMGHPPCVSGHPVSTQATSPHKG